MANKYQGLTTHNTTTIPKRAKKICVTSIITPGKISSTWPRSLEKRLSIRPDGLVLKKYIDARVTPWNIVLCKLMEDRLAKLKNSKDRNKAKNIIDTFIAVKMYKSVESVLRCKRASGRL